MVCMSSGLSSHFGMRSSRVSVGNSSGRREDTGMSRRGSSRPLTPLPPALPDIAQVPDMPVVGITLRAPVLQCAPPCAAPRGAEMSNHITSVAPVAVVETGSSSETKRQTEWYIPRILKRQKHGNLANLPEVCIEPTNADRRLVHVLALQSNTGISDNQELEYDSSRLSFESPRSRELPQNLWSNADTLANLLCCDETEAALAEDGDDDDGYPEPLAPYNSPVRDDFPQIDAITSAVSPNSVRRPPIATMNLLANSGMKSRTPRPRCGIIFPTPRALERVQKCEDNVFKSLRVHELRQPVVQGFEGEEDCLISERHRKLMVNWLIEFASEFRLQVETLILGVTLMDKCLYDGTPIKCSSLQLLGIACMVIAVKFEEADPLNRNLVRQACELTDCIFTFREVVEMERYVLTLIKYACATPTPTTFIWPYLEVAEVGSMFDELVQYLACLSLLDHNILKLGPSVVAASTIVLARYATEQSPIWTDALEESSGYTLHDADIQTCVQSLHQLHMEAFKWHAQKWSVAIRFRYEALQFGGLSKYQYKIAIPDKLTGPSFL